jgi:hypothetical protein
MKVFRLFRLVWFTFYLPISLSLLAQSQNSGLTAALEFGGNFLDSSGLGNDATQFGGVSFSPNLFGVPGSSAHFDGLDSQRLVIPDSPSLHSPHVTVSCWFRTGDNRSMQLAVKGHYPDSIGEQWSLYIYDETPPAAQLVFGIKRNSNGQVGQGWYFISSTNRLSLTNQWQLAVGTWDGTNEVVYLNGEIAGSTSNVPAGGIDDVPLGDIVIGRSTVAPYLFRGDIDDFRVYNRALSAAEVKSLYQQSTAAVRSDRATAYATTDGGFVVGVTVSSPGKGYTNAPVVTLVGGGGKGAVAVASITNGMVSAISIQNPGSGYTNAPTVQIDPPGPEQATAIAHVVNGFVTTITVTDTGSGYTNAPVVRLVGGGGSGAVAVASVVDGSIDTIKVVNPGNGYTNSPVVWLAPPFLPPAPQPSIGVRVKAVTVSQHVTVGRVYVLESSTDLENWSVSIPPFIASSELLEQSLDVGSGPTFFRLRDLSVE